MTCHSPVRFVLYPTFVASTLHTWARLWILYGPYKSGHDYQARLLAYMHYQACIRMITNHRQYKQHIYNTAAALQLEHISQDKAQSAHRSRSLYQSYLSVLSVRHIYQSSSDPLPYPPNKPPNPAPSPEPSSLPSFTAVFCFLLSGSCTSFCRPAAAL